MAIAIKETPVLSGKDSKHFIEKVKKEENNKVSDAEYKKAVNLYKKVIKNNPNFK